MPHLTPDDGVRAAAPLPKDHADWPWLLGRDMQELADWADDPDMWDWLREAYAWRYWRLPEEKRAGLPVPIAVGGFGFPPAAFPVLAGNAASGENCFALIRTALEPADPGVETSRDNAAGAAATAALGLLRARRAHVRVFWDEATPGQFDGESAALSAFAQMCLALLNLPVPDTLAASGGWEDGQFGLVEPTSLADKLRAAADWGIRRILLVEGQENWREAGWPEEAVVFLPRQPSLALPLLIKTVVTLNGSGPEEADEALAEALAAFDREVVNCEPNRRDLRATMERTQPYVDGVDPVDMPLSSFLARDLRSRARLHAGDVAGAEEEMTALGAGFALPHPLPHGWLGLYLGYEVKAHRSVIAIDTGRWDDDYREHALVDDAIATLEKDAGGVERMLVASWLRSTRAMRLRFIGRLEKKVALVRRALEDLLRYDASAMRLARHAVVDMGMGNHGGSRRQNYLIKTYANLWDARELDAGDRRRAGGLWPAEMPELAADFPTGARWLQPGEKRGLSGFDVAAWLQLRGILDLPVTKADVEKALRLAEASIPEGGELWYPWTLPVENIIRYGFGDEGQTAKCAELLGKAVYFNPEFRNGMFAVLGIRAAALTGMADTAPIRPEDEVYPDLAELFDRLIELPASERVACVPY